MDIKAHIKALLQEADVYRSQGLFDEAKRKYIQALQIIKKNEKMIRSNNLFNAISNKIRALDNYSGTDARPLKSPRVSPQAQDLIKKLFSFSKEKDRDAAALEGAIALAKFGQVERALAEFTQFLAKDSLRVVSAKNILRCHIELSSIDRAVEQYGEWLAGDLFPPNHLRKVHSFLEDIIRKKGLKIQLPQKELPQEIEQIETIEDIGIIEAEAITEPGPRNMPEPPPLKKPAQIRQASKSEAEKPEKKIQVAVEAHPEKKPAAQKAPAKDPPPEKEEFLDISSIAIELPNGESCELDVSFQSGNMISSIISKKQKELIDQLVVGLKLEDIQFYSPIAIFAGSGTISAKTQIEAGPKKGDYCLDIKMSSS